MQSFQIIPAIDIKNEKSLRVKNTTDPIELTKKYEQQGAEYLHLVDINGAIYNNPVNLHLIKKIIEKSNCKIEVSAGVDNLEKIEQINKLNPWQIIISSNSLFNIKNIKEIARETNKENVTISIDHNNGHLAARGKLKNSDISIYEIAKKLRVLKFQRYIMTNINDDGMLKMSNLEYALKFKEIISEDVILSGGVNSIEDIQKIKSYGFSGVIIGRALNEGKLALNEIYKKID
jgi:phosphoribosylformimino-5-aminoimidazole carboxamide ribotide isomerase